MVIGVVIFDVFLYGVWDFKFEGGIVIFCYELKNKFILWLCMVFFMNFYGYCCVDFNLDVGRNMKLGF